jgi:hypothetical protein
VANWDGSHVVFCADAGAAMHTAIASRGRPRGIVLMGAE